MKIDTNAVVSIHYVLTNTSGEQLDSSQGKEPLAYLHGTGGLIPGLEQALKGHKVGEAMDVSIAPEDAYGLVNDDLIQDVPRSAFDGVEVIEPGMQFQASGEGGQTQMITVAKVAEDLVTVDANHPLAGQTLNFSVTIEDVRAATEEEIAHGHIHS